jgi:hypothetical protein
VIPIFILIKIQIFEIPKPTAGSIRLECTLGSGIFIWKLGDALNEKKPLNYANAFGNGAREPQKFWSHSKVTVTKDARPPPRLLIRESRSVKEPILDGF